MIAAHVIRCWHWLCYPEIAELLRQKWRLAYIIGWNWNNIGSPNNNTQSSNKKQQICLWVKCTVWTNTSFDLHRTKRYRSARGSKPALTQSAAVRFHIVGFKAFSCSSRTTKKRTIDSWELMLTLTIEQTIIFLVTNIWWSQTQPNSKMYRDCTTIQSA